MGRLILKNGMVLTLDESGSYHETGTVVIEGDKITDIVPGSPPIEAKPGDEVIDATDKIIMPGLIDLHYHTAIGKGYNDHMPLWEYLDECWYPLIRALDPEARLLGGDGIVHGIDQVRLHHGERHVPAA